MTNHTGLTAERWGRFGLDQRLLMIANEMHRCLDAIDRVDGATLVNGYERALRLLDLTVEVGVRRNLRRELLRWRDVVAELYLRPEPDRPAHVDALRALLYLSPEASKQIGALGLEP